MFTKKITVQPYELALVFKHKRLTSVLSEGRWSVKGTVQIFDTRKPRVEGDLVDMLWNHNDTSLLQHCEKIETQALEITIVRRKGQIVDIIGPQTQAIFWKGTAPLTFERLSVQGGLTLPEGHDLYNSQNTHWLKFFVDVHPGQSAFALVDVDKTLRDIVRPGERKLYWKDLEVIEVQALHATVSIPKETQIVILSLYPEWLEHFVYVEMKAHELTLVYRGTAFASIVAPTQSGMYLKDNVTRLETIDISDDFRVPHEIAVTLKGHPLAACVEYVEVPEHHMGLLYCDGKLHESLAVGGHAFWKVGRHLRSHVMDLRLQILEVGGQEILTRDKISVRLNLTAGYRIVDPLLVTSKLVDIEAYLYKELQFALRAAVGTRTLDEILDNKGFLDPFIFEFISEKASGLGLALESVGVKDIILPGEMKAILSRVVEAEKSAQANVIRRREETAATRSLLNTARVMEDNPVALRLKELETLERITEKIDSITVHGGLEGILSDLIKIGSGKVT